MRSPEPFAFATLLERIRLGSLAGLAERRPSAACSLKVQPLCLTRHLLPAPMPLLKFLPENTKIDFVGVRYYAFAIDGLLLLASIISIALHGFNLGIDFTGGVLLEVKAAHEINIGQVRTEVDSLGFSETQLQTFGGGACNTPAQFLRADPGAAKTQPVRHRYRQYHQDEAGRRLHHAKPAGDRPQGQPGTVRRRYSRDHSRRHRYRRLCLGAVRMAVRHRRRCGDGTRRVRHRRAVLDPALGFHPDLHRGAADPGRLFHQRHRGGVRPDPRRIGANTSACRLAS